VVDAGEGTAVIEALLAAGASPWDGTYRSFGLGERERSRLVTITLAPILPFYEGIC
jgi:hypothetical protein